MSKQSQVEARHNAAGEEADQAQQYRGDVNQPSPELLRQIAVALNGGEKTPAVEKWMAQHRRMFPEPEKA